jgi:ATP-dependent DNA ligase
MIAQSVAASPRQEGLSVSALAAYLAHMLQRTLPAGFIAPCLATKAHTLPSGGLWLHEIKHDGFRVIARKDGDRVRLYSRPGNDLTGASSFQRPRNPQRGHSDRGTLTTKRGVL